jgi:hypothetical protein
MTLCGTRSSTSTTSGDLRRLVKIYAESIRQLTLDHLELETKLYAAADIAVLPSHRSR